MTEQCVWLVCRIAAVAFVLGCVYVSSSADGPQLPNTYPTIAEDIAHDCWARHRFHTSPPPGEVSLRFYAFQYRHNTQPLLIEINGKTVTYTSQQGYGVFQWHDCAIPRGCLRNGANEIIFRSDHHPADSWAIAIEHVQQPAGSAKSWDRGRTWYSQNLGFNYSVVGQYAVRLVAADGTDIAMQAAPHQEVPSETVQQRPSPPPTQTPEITDDVQLEQFRFSRSLGDDALAQCLRDAHIEMDAERGGARLRRGELIKDEQGNAQLNIDRSAFSAEDALTAPYWMGEQISDTVWIKKKLELDDAQTHGAFLMFFYEIWARTQRAGGYLHASGGPEEPLLASVNGIELEPIAPDLDWRERTDDWRLVEFPRDLLSTGTNTIVLRTTAEGDWRFAYENSVQPNHSARSTDAGATWDYNRLGENANDNGEYLVRLYLDRYHAEGLVWSAPMALWDDDADGLMQRIEDGDLHIRVSGDIPAQTGMEVQVRFGSSPVPDTGSWTEWSAPAADGRLRVALPVAGCSYMQWQVRLKTADRLVTPLLQSVRISVHGQRRQAGEQDARLACRVNNPELHLSSYPMQYNRFGNERLGYLCDRYQLDKAVAGCNSDFEKLLKLCDRAHSCMKQPPAQKLLRPEGNWVTHWATNDALIELDFVQRGYGHLQRRFGSHCHQYAHIYVAFCQAMGYIARPLLMTRMFPPSGGHCFCEVWSDDYNKWVLVDPTGNCYYLRDDGIPINTCELHEAQFDEKLLSRIFIVPVQKDAQSPRLHGGGRPQGWSDAPKGYEAFSIWLRNDFADRPAPYPIWDGVHTFRWDGRLWCQDLRVRFFPEFTYHTTRWDDMYWGVNQCFIEAEYPGDGRVLIHLSHNMLYFDLYSVDVDGEQQPPNRSGEVMWTLHPGLNRLAVRAVSRHGISGPTSSVTIEFEP